MSPKNSVWNVTRKATSRRSPSAAGVAAADAAGSSSYSMPVIVASSLIAV